MDTVEWKLYFDEKRLQDSLQSLGMTHSSIALIRRPLLGHLPGLHYGVAVPEVGRFVVHHISAANGLVIADSLSNFALGKNIEVELVRPLSVEERLKLNFRVQVAQVSFSRYGILQNNCEDVARFLLTGSRQSHQSLVWIVLVAIGALSFSKRAA